MTNKAVLASSGALLALALWIAIDLAIGESDTKGEHSTITAERGGIEARGADHEHILGSSHFERMEARPPDANVAAEAVVDGHDNAGDSADLEPAGKVWRLGEAVPPELAPWKHLQRNLPLSDPAEFEFKYSGFSKDQLVEAHKQVTAELMERKNQALTDRYNSGQFMQRQANMEIDLNYDGIADPQLGFQLQPSGVEPYTTAFAYQAQSGGSEVKVVWLPWTEYPEIYQLKDETKWLTKAKKTAVP